MYTSYIVGSRLLLSLRVLFLLAVTVARIETTSSFIPNTQRSKIHSHHHFQIYSFHRLANQRVAESILLHQHCQQKERLKQSHSKSDSNESTSITRCRSDVFTKNSAVKQIQKKKKVMNISGVRSITNNMASATRRNSILYVLTHSLSFLTLILSGASSSKALAGQEEVTDKSSSNKESITNVEEICRDGSIVAEEAVPGSYQQICMTLPERSLTLKTTGDTLTIQQASASNEGGAGRTGMFIWNSSLLYTRFLDKLASATTTTTAANTLSNFFTNKTIFELGCGTGLASIAVAKLGTTTTSATTTVYATDGNSNVIELTQQNIEKNHVTNTVQAISLPWGLLNAADYSDSADIILGSDLTYNSGSWPLLAETVEMMLKPKTGLFVYLTCGHAGFNLMSELGGFVNVAQNLGLVVLNERDERWPFYYYDNKQQQNNNNIGTAEIGTSGGFKNILSLSTLLQQTITTKEQSVIDTTRGVKVVVFAKK